MTTPLEIARESAVAGGAVLRAHRNDIGRIRTKSSDTDFVTETDIRSGIACVEAILARDPAARVVVEEPEVCEQLGIEPGSVDDHEVWLIDPLDGTTSYLHGFPCYSVSVAYVVAGNPVAGAVYNPVLDELVSAMSGAGATVGDAVARCSHAATVSDALVITGFPYDRGAPLDRQLAVLGAFLRAPVHGIRRDGSAAIDCCHVATGRADGFWEYFLKPWDMAAGAVICREAGATVTDAEGAQWTSASTSILAANPALHPRMLQVIASVP